MWPILTRGVGAIVDNTSEAESGVTVAASIRSGDAPDNASEAVDGLVAPLSAEGASLESDRLTVGGAKTKFSSWIGPPAEMTRFADGGTYKLASEQIGAAPESDKATAAGARVFGVSPGASPVRVNAAVDGLRFRPTESDGVDEDSARDDDAGVARLFCTAIGDVAESDRPATAVIYPTPATGATPSSVKPLADGDRILSCELIGALPDNAMAAAGAVKVIAVVELGTDPDNASETDAGMRLLPVNSTGASADNKIVAAAGAPILFTTVFGICPDSDRLQTVGTIVRANVRLGAEDDNANAATAGSSGIFWFTVGAGPESASDAASGEFMSVCAESGAGPDSVSEPTGETAARPLIVIRGVTV